MTEKKETLPKAARMQILQEKMNRQWALYHQYFRAGDYQSALAEVRQAQKMSDAIEVFIAEAACLSRMGRGEEAYALARSIPESKSQNDANFCDLMAEICGGLGKKEEWKSYGSRALALKDQQNSAQPAWPLPAEKPPAFVRDSSKNIIAYSLWGHNPRYCEGAVLNCHAAARLLPDWTCRFYHDQSVPADTLRRLRNAGAQLVSVNDGIKKQIPPLMWRFLVADSPEVCRFMIRDADSVVSEREKVCVDAWVRSPFWFHLIRDCFSHTELLLAGLWGGCSGVIPNMRHEIVTFMAQGQRSKSHYDQHFLRERLWPTVRQSVLSYDSQFDFFNNIPIPVVDGEKSDGEHHIGANLGATRMSGKIPYPDGTPIRWTIYDTAGEPVCMYEEAARNHTWSAYLPIDYVLRLNAGQWKLQTTKIAPA